ncbi:MULTISPECIES: hypothetical protein [Companilactobacillus]|nr:MULTISPECIES: hypothetical protein [Companilactobacillus]
MKKSLIELTKEYIDSLDEGMMDASFDRLKLIQKKYITPEIEGVKIIETVKVPEKKSNITYDVSNEMSITLECAA